MRGFHGALGVVLCLTGCFSEDADESDEAESVSTTQSSDAATSDDATLTASSDGETTTGPTTTTGQTTGAVDSGSDTNEASSSGTGAPADWWDADWSTRYRLSFNGGGPDAELVDFPVLVVLTSARVDYGIIAPGGADLRFVASDGVTVLAHEIERWVDGGTSHVWVNVPAVNLGQGADAIDLYVDNDMAEPAQQPEDVWSSSYAAVFHLADDLGADPTAVQGSVGPDAEARGGMGADAGVDGPIGGALAFDGDNDMLVYDMDPQPADAVTVEAWVSLGADDETGYVHSLADLAGRPGNYSLLPVAALAVGSGGDADFHVQSDLAEMTVSGPEPSADEWAHLALTWRSDTGVVAAYYDGQPAGQATVMGAVLLDLPQPWTIGNAADGLDGSGQNRWLLGAIDEARVARVAHSADWIEAQYLSMTDALISYGPGESP